MEQKQLDEVNEYFGDEFIDEDDFVEIVEGKATGSFTKLNKQKAKPEKKPVSKKTEKKEGNQESFNDSNRTIFLEDEKSVGPKDNKKDHLGSKRTENSFVSSSSNDPDRSSKAEKISDSWGDGSHDKNSPDESMFKDVSTWKALTGILVILLVFSVFTQGFQFSETSAATVNALSLSEAETKVLDYVNNNLLQPPFTAELESSEDVGNLYMITLQVAGQTVDSYLTKDGKLFFPQGLDTSLDLKETLDKPSVDLEEVEPEQQEAGLPEETPVEETVVDELAADEDAVEEAPEETDTAPVVEEEEVPVEETNGETKTFTLNAKRWLFSPSKLTAKEGDLVVLTIVPEGLDFTFLIPGLGIEEEVSGQTTVQFKAGQAGTYGFACGSCEEWRGMTGELVIE